MLIIRLGSLERRNGSQYRVKSFYVNNNYDKKDPMYHNIALIKI
jgi:hypothetical protein